MFTSLVRLRGEGDVSALRSKGPLIEADTRRATASLTNLKDDFGASI